jgi:hypothetical protein
MEVRVMGAQATDENQPDWSAIFVLVAIVFGGLVALGYELIVNNYDERNICERAAANPQKAFRDVLRGCRLDEWGKQFPLTPAEERALREEMEAG